jgi:uncharacterized protein with HEPN domain
VNRSAPERLTDILAAIDRTLTYRPRLDDPDPSVAAMASDAVLRNVVVQEYFRGDPRVVDDVIDTDLTTLAHVVRSRLLDVP